MDGRNGRSDGQTDEWIDAWLDGGMDGVVFAALKLRILFLRFFLFLSIVCSFFSIYLFKQVDEIRVILF